MKCKFFLPWGDEQWKLRGFLKSLASLNKFEPWWGGTGPTFFSKQEKFSIATLKKNESQYYTCYVEINYPRVLFLIVFHNSNPMFCFDFIFVFVFVFLWEDIVGVDKNHHDLAWCQTQDTLLYNYWSHRCWPEWEDDRILLFAQ